MKLQVLCCCNVLITLGAFHAEEVLVGWSNSFDICASPPFLSICFHFPQSVKVMSSFQTGKSLSHLGVYSLAAQRLGTTGGEWLNCSQVLCSQLLFCQCSVCFTQRSTADVCLQEMLANNWGCCDGDVRLQCMTFGTVKKLPVSEGS